MLDYILQQFSNNSKFINDLDGVYKYLDSLNLNYDEKEKILMDISNYNEKIYLLMKKENKELERIITKPLSNISEHKELVFPKEELKNEESIITLEVDAKELLSRIRVSKSLEEMKNILPTKNSLNYSQIINVIILGLYEDIMDYKKILILDNNISSEELQEIKFEINNLLLKINYLKKLNVKPIKVLVDKKESTNTLLFLKTASGNYSIFSDLKEIPSENYNIFYTLLTEMLEDNFKNFKRLSDNGTVSGVMEVKYNQARITFIPVGKNKYVILDMFIKKVYTDANYKASLKNKYDLFKDNYSSINNLLFNEEYLEENRKILDNLLATLNTGNKVKKIGDFYE